METLKANQTRPSTLQNYMTIWRQFNKFLIKLDQRTTSWENRVVLYGTYLVDNGAQSSSVKSYFSAIKHILKMDGYQWNDNQAMLNIVTKSCRIINDRLKVRLPIGRRLLELVLYEVQRYYNSQPYLEKLYSTIFCLCYY